MPVDSILQMNLAGTYCGVPFATGFTYKQVEPDPLATTTGRQLVESWFSDNPGPWTHIRPSLSDQLTIECAVVTYDTITETVLLAGGSGTAAGPSLPPANCLQISTPGNDPHAAGYEGRAFWPGWLIADTFRGGWDPDFLPTLNTWMSRLLQVDNSPGSFRYLLYPHFKYRDRGSDVSNIVEEPFFHPFQKIIGNRTADDCATFGATGASQFGGFQIPAPI